MSYMQELDDWTMRTLIDPLFTVWRDSERVADPADEEAAERDLAEVVAQVKKALREKVLESYRNGQASRSPAEKPKGRPQTKRA